MIEMKNNKLKVGNVPNLRFPGFEGEWKMKKLGEVLDFKVTNSFSRENLNYERGTVKNIHYGDIHTKFSTLFDITKEEVPYLNLDIPIKLKINKNKNNLFTPNDDLSVLFIILKLININLTYFLFIIVVVEKSKFNYH